MAYSSATGGVSLPDFRNLGILGRALVLAEAANWIAVLAQSRSFADAFVQFSTWAPSYEPAMLLALLCLAALAPVLGRLSYRGGVVAVLGICAGAALAMGWGVGTLLAFSAPADPLKTVVVAVCVAGLILMYFDWRQRRLSPALGEARLAALQARIRPHFLFNSLNTAVSVVRQDPVLAERILLDLSDLFRGVLAERRGMVPLSQELELARAYAQIESLRLGDRLRLQWQVDEAALAAHVPILLLQPLVENAVRYGIEPLAEGGEVEVRVARAGRMVELSVRNGVGPAGVPAGNGMALANIRERLALHFDAEARLQAGSDGGGFLVRVELPFTAARRPGGGRATDPAQP